MKNALLTTATLVVAFADTTSAPYAQFASFLSPAYFGAS
jgi:hypothetical protein